MSKYFDYALSQVSEDVKSFIDNSMRIADQIHSILERQGRTQKDLADMLGKRESQISKWLSGTHNFTLKSLSKIENVLNEKIISTPIQLDKDFIKMTENATEILKTTFKDYSPVPSLPKKQTSVFVEVTQTIHRAGEIYEQHSYALVA